MGDIASRGLSVVLTDPITLVALAAAGSVLVALSAIFLLIRFGLRPAAFPEVSGRTVFLLRQDRVIDASQAGSDILDGLGPDGWTAQRIVGWLSELFPELPTHLSQKNTPRSGALIGQDGISRLKLAADGDCLRLTLTNDGNERVQMDRILHNAIQTELETLRSMTDTLPIPVWKCDASGRILWVNRAYMDLADAADLSSQWPPAPLFDLNGAVPGQVRRLQLNGRWFDCTVSGIKDGPVVSAVPVDDLVAAKNALETFKQTMSRTFAQLMVGLAIFDHERRLAVFNPALLDLTKLPIDVLIAKPSLESFLDALRARQMMPEPRDYGTWRDKIIDVETAAQNGTYSELWHLPGGRTYRITGRPQTDGAFALLFEDITAEIDLTRRFRAEIETTNAVIDALPDAIAVFDATGTMTVSNQAYDHLWGTATQDRIDTVSLSEAQRTWCARAEIPNIEDLIAQTVEASARPAADVRMDDGRRLTVSVQKLVGCATMIRFVQHSAAISTIMPARAHAQIESRLKA
ncbi:Sensor protein DivL [Rhodobacteraceae bacterium THAF1]|uniref:PAS-domain containing protein n=1 Tax=Palleronia sp. THAF1 TaxID=2587842 RepID=UPI000F3AC297|nr:PAS-domain containing protein [Palleronia sp. THAF1]QFU10134.1 Sensor protein DivL [Palleronia sp. THAF1]VDC16961.1 Sensor protein DivL [Rhodobacteraceae bacterium THAF1]